jgi:hypothetical protein
MPPSVKAAQNTHNTTSQQQHHQQHNSDTFTDMTRSKQKHKKAKGAESAQSNKSNAIPSSASTTKPQSTRAQRTVDSDVEGLSSKEQSLPSVIATRPIKPCKKQAMGFIEDPDKTPYASKTIFGLPTAPATPQLESISDSDPQKTQYNKSCVPTLKRAWSEGVKRTIGLKFTPTTENSRMNWLRASKQSRSWNLSSLSLLKS